MRSARQGQKDQETELEAHEGMVEIPAVSYITYYLRRHNLETLKLILFQSIQSFSIIAHAAHRVLLRTDIIINVPYLYFNLLDTPETLSNGISCIPINLDNCISIPLH